MDNSPVTTTVLQEGSGVTISGFQVKALQVVKIKIEKFTNPAQLNQNFTIQLKQVGPIKRSSKALAPLLENKVTIAKVNQSNSEINKASNFQFIFEVPIKDRVDRIEIEFPI